MARIGRSKGVPAAIRPSGRVRSCAAALAAPAIGAYIGAAYWFTSSTSFANPAVTVGRAFSDTFAAPVSVPGFVVAQLVGLLVGVALIALLYPHEPPDEAVVLVDVDADEPTDRGPVTACGA